MLGNKNTNKKTVMGGVGIALLLCALMVGMTMTNLVQTEAPQVETELAIANEESEDYFALPDVYEPAKYEYDESSELEGMRSMHQKAFRTDDGNTALITAQEPLHYMSEIGSWEQIDLNIMATANGWEVKENLYEVTFSPEVQDGVSVMVHPNVDPIVTGLNPMVVTIDESGYMPQPYMVSPAEDAVSVGGNALRYPIAEGFDLDYTVTETQLKQNLVIRERPVLDDSAAYFGVTEQMRIPAGFGLFLGDDMLREEVTQTQDELSIRNLETGEELVSIPVPVVYEMNSDEEPYHATYFIQVYGNTVILTTAVEADWLMEEDRQFPLAIDPSVKVTRSNGGYCYVYSRNCYNNSYSYIQRYSNRIYYTPWHKYSFTAANQLPTGATIDKIEWQQYVRYGYTYAAGTTTFNAVIMEDCGSQARYQYLIASRTCNGNALTGYPTGSIYNTAKAAKMISSAWNSPTVDTYATGTGWRTADICSSSTACAATTGSHQHVISALNNGGEVAMSANYPTAAQMRHYSYNYGSTNSYLAITYSGGSDTTPPIDGFVPYSGITSYKEGARTFFTNLMDNAGIDTTSTGAPHLHYSINNGSYTAVKATSIGTCGSSATSCDFRATTGDLSTGDYVKYFWAYMDNAATPNLGTSPAGGSGTSSTATAPASPYWFMIEDVDNGGNDRKMTVTTTDVRAYSTSSTAKTFDRQMTYYDNSDEYVFEFDTSECGTGGNSCFYTSSYYYYAQWEMQWTNAPPSGTNGYGGTVAGSMKMHSSDAGGYLTINAAHGPGMNLIYLYHATTNKWAMVGLDGDTSTSGMQTGIEQLMTSGSTAAKRTTYGNTAGHLVDIPGEITGTFGKFDWNATSSSSKANWMCVGTNGFYYFFRSNSVNPSCNTGYYYVYSSYYRYSGFALGTGSGGVMAGTGSIIYKVAKVAPEPDTSPPDIGHSAMRDSHSRDRTFAFTIADAGEPPSGLNVSTDIGVGPTLWYRITDVNGTVGSWTSTLLSPSGGDRAACSTASCDWTSTLEDLERGSTTEYYVTAKDLSPAATGINSNNTSSAGYSFEVGDPSKVFIIEWHDVGYTQTYTCTYQVLLYDTTNEIEFQYDTGCKATYDYATVGYQDQTRNEGTTLRAAKGYLNGGNPHTVNYRIGTDSNGHSSETFDLGMTELPTYDTAIAGASNGRPYGYYCYSAYYWNTYKSGCNANIDLPDGFVFDYFGTEYNGSDSKNRVHISRFGNMYLKDDGSTALERSLYATSNMPDLPNKGTYAMAGMIAPWWGYYSSYYCYDNTNLDCSVRTRVIPFEGKGTDVSADITQPTTWSKIDSPIRVNPSSSSGYLSIGDDLTIEPGVVVQVASGKGLSFDGACDSLTATGNSTDHILFEGQNGGTWKGLAFTAACSTGTDDRHELSYVDFANTTDAAIAAGSRHGSSPSSNANVGNFTMDHVTFSNVGAAFKHGSGQGTVLTMSDFEISNAKDSCFDLAEDSEVTLRDGDMDDCNSNGNSWGGAVINYPGSTSGLLNMTNITITDSLVNLINVDFETVIITNLTATNAASQSGTPLTSAGDSADSVLSITDMDASGYTGASAIHALKSISLENVDWGSSDLGIAPGGTTSTAAGPFGVSASIEELTAGDLAMTRMAPTMYDIDVEALSIGGNSPSSIGIKGSDWVTSGIAVNGCGYNILVATVSTDYISGSCSNSAAPNNIILSDVDATYTGTMNAIYARNSAITIGEGSISMPSTFDKMSKASTNGRIVLIDVDQDGTDCESSTSGCDVSSGSSGAIYFGGLATVKVYKLLGGGIKEYKEGHTVQAIATDAGAVLFPVGVHKTDSNGEASVWVISGNDAGDAFDDHNLGAWGPSGQNETLITDAWYPGSFGVGDSIELRLEPAPVDLNGTNMDCAFLSTHPDAVLGYDGSIANGGTNTYTWEGKVTMSGDLNIDDCNIIMRNVFRVSSDATNSPKLTISNGGHLLLEKTGSGATTVIGTLKATSSTYPLDLDMDGGTLTLDGGAIRDVKGGISLDSGTLIAENSATIYGNANAAATEATLYVTGGTLDWDDSTIMNAGQTGIGLMFERTGGSVDNIIVKNAAVGIYSYNAAPTINGFTLTDNDVGVDVHGGMSLPTIYRSTLLSGESTGWTTYAIDMSTYLGSGDDFLQVGFNSVYGGGNAHPRYNYYTSKYYMLYDRMNIELTDNVGNSWNITSTTTDGYYDGALGGDGGVPSWHCNNYGYSYNPAYWDYSYNKPTGWDWEDTEFSVNSYYPLHYWGYYYTSYHGGTGVYQPPEGYQGSYNVCLDYAYTYYNSPGNSQRLSYPVVDVSGGNITGVKMYIDVLHNRADNYQDRLEILARTGDDPSDLGGFMRESGTPSFDTGSITGAKNGIEIGGMWAAAEFEDVTVTSPTNAGLEITGSSAATVKDLTVAGGNYGVLAGAGSSGNVELSNVDITGTSTAGVYYVKDLAGDLTGSISGSTGAGLKFGSATSKDLSWDSMTLSGNAVGIDTAGSGDLTFTDSTFANTIDFEISGASVVDFIEGTVDTNAVTVTGNGVFNRMRSLDIAVTADSSSVSGANIILKNAAGEATGSAITDTNGDAVGLTFVTQTVDSTSGLVVNSLSGYEAVTVAKVGSYYYTNPSTNSGDFRYTFDTVSLSDIPGNSHTMDLVDTVDARVCYSYSSTSYGVVEQCASGLSTSGLRTYSSGMVEYGYYGATPRVMDNQVMMIDTGIWYVDGNSDNSLNGTTILSTGTYNSQDSMQLWSTSPYGARMWSHNAEWVSTAVDDDGNAQGIKIGYNGWNDIVPDIQNTTISGLATIVTTFGYKSTWGNYVWKADFFNIQNNTFTHFRNTDNVGAAQNQDMCLNAGGANTTIANNVMKNCGVGVFLTRTGFSYSYTQAFWGADDAVVHDNDFIGTSHIDVWFSLNSYTDGAEITDNTFSGTSAPSYGVYAQDRTTTDLLIEGNTFSNSDEAIYMRGALDWEIKENVVNGKGDSSMAGIYVKDGYGVIDGNTLVDADGGILVDGIRYGFNVNVTNNDLSQTTGRVAPTAVGIWAEDCGSSSVNTGGNTVSVMENALVTDGCDLVDSGSSFEAIGGTGGAVYTVQMNANAYAPSTLNINEGDTVRWRSNEYFNNSGQGEPHDVTSNDTDAGGLPDWSSGGTMNLGTTYTKTFSTAGTYEYHCSIHPAMTGKIVVATGSGSGFDSLGVNVIGSTDDITLDGSSVSGFETGIEQYGGSMTLSGDTIISGGSYAAYAEDTDVVIDGAELIADSTGSAMYVTGTSTFDATDMDTSGMYGLNIDAVDFRWNGGDSDAATSLMADGGAEGSVENVTWADTTTQIRAGSYVTVTSVGNTVTASKLIVDATAVIHEGNLLDLDITHKGGDATDVGVLIQSTDGAQAAYVSPAYRAPYMSADGDLAEWYGNVKNPSDDAMPGVMSSDDAGEDFLATWDANNLYMALTGVDMSSADLQIYIDSSTGGDTTGDSWYVSHSLPFAADYVFWAEDGGDGNNGLKVNGFSGWTDVSSACSGLSHYIGNSADTDTEIAIPWTCIGEPSTTVRMIVVVQDESTGAIESVHPDQTVTTGAVAQSFNEELTLLMGHGDLAAGDDLTNHLLIYRSYVGSSTPTDAKNYDISVKVEAACAEDWHTVNNVDMSTNVVQAMDIKRACPVIENLLDITVNEDSGTYMLTLSDKANDVQDDAASVDLAWTVADDADPSKSPGMLLASNLDATQLEMDITPDHDQFGQYTFHFEVEDTHGLKDSKTITFTVININDAPIICNTERADCMPVFADDGAGNLNVLDEGFGSVSKVLGSAANATGSYVVDMASNDMANEQPQVYSWGATIKGDDVTVDPYWVQKKYDSVAEMFAEAGAAVTSQGGFQEVEMTGDPTSISPNGTYTLPTLNNVSLLTYLLAQNGCGSVWYQEYMDSSGNKVTAVRSDDGCDSTIDANAKVYNSLNYTDFWLEAYGVDVTAYETTTTWDSVFPNGYTTTGGYNPCPAFSVSVVNNELAIIENADNELGGECTIVLTLNDDGGYCANAYLGRTANVKASCVSYTWLIDYTVMHPVYNVPVTVTGCYNLYLGFASFVPPYMPDGTPTGMNEDICLGYSWVGENTAAVDYEVNFSVTPVNDAPVVLDWDRQNGVAISNGYEEVPPFPWKVTLTEDEQDSLNLTYDLAAMKDDNDHNDEDLTWSIEKSDTCDYENYFSATIVGDEIVFDLIKDATTNAPEWEVDYLNNGGIHQQNPLSGEFCPITLNLRDSPTAPSYVPNYGMSTADYQQYEDSVTLYVRVDNVAENVPDYFLSDITGFDYNGVSNVMPGTYVPTTVTIGHGGDQGPYNYDHMLEVTFHSNGYDSVDSKGEEYCAEESCVDLGTQYIIPPAYGQTLEVMDYVYIASTTNRIWVEVDVLTCVDTTCDMFKAPEDRYFGYSFPHAHACVNDGQQGAAWSCPGEVGFSGVTEDGEPSIVDFTNNRRPMLEDQDWCNNLMSTDDEPTECAQPRNLGSTIATGQETPNVVRLIGTADVPSFAPSIIAISAAGLFVSALVLQSRREDEEESLEEMTLDEDEQAVSPVIATILMVAITVVLSGVIYVWASSLADTSAKGVPRMTFDVDNVDGEYYRIVVTASQVELATQAVQVDINYIDSDGTEVLATYNLAETTVYGFFPGNSDSMVTFGDTVGEDDGTTTSSFDTGDTIYIKSIDVNGEPITDMYVTISYVPDAGSDGAVLRTWDSL